MNAARLMGQLRALAAQRAERAVAEATPMLAARLADGLPDVAAVAGDGVVMLRAPGLRVRASGSRTMTADARLLAVVGERR